MAGRGRGRGAGLSLTAEQLQTLGVSRGEAPAPTLAPPPLFPKLEARPLPLPVDSATDYMLVVKDQFVEYVQDSPAFVRTRAEKDDVERYSDKYKLLALDVKRTGTLECVWSRMPPELRPMARRGRSIANKRKLADPTEIAKRLQTLEKNEEMLDKSVEKPRPVDRGEVKKEGDSDDEDLEEEQEYEADDGTDYANNYFDNGEDYDEDDDTLDDDPVY